MKKDFSQYDRPAIHRLVRYQAFQKVVVGLTLVLLWDRTLNGGRLELLRDGCFVAAAIFAVLAWFSYLSLDGMRLPFLPPKKEKKRHWQRDMIDFVDEHVTTMDELSDDERSVVKLFSSLLCAAIFLAAALVGWLLS